MVAAPVTGLGSIDSIRVRDWAAKPLPVRLRGTLVPVGASFGVSWFRTLCGFVRTPDDSILLQAIEDKGQTLKPLGLGTIKTQIVDLYHARTAVGVSTQVVSQ